MCDTYYILSLLYHVQYLYRLYSNRKTYTPAHLENNVQFNHVFIQWTKLEQRHLNLPVPPPKHPYIFTPLYRHGSMISKAQTEPIKPLRSFSDASHRDLKGWWQMVVNSQLPEVEENQRNNKNTTTLQQLTFIPVPPREVLMPGHKSLLSIFDVSSKDVKEQQCFGWLICLPNTPIIPSTSYVSIYFHYIIYICLWEKMYMWNAIHTCRIYKNMYRIIAFMNVIDEVHPYNCSNRQRTTNLAEEGTSTSTLWLTSFIAVLLDLHKPLRDPPLQPLSNKARRYAFIYLYTNWRYRMIMPKLLYNKIC